MTTRPRNVGHRAEVARVLVGGLLVLFAVLILVSPPEGGVPVPELVASAIVIAGALTIVGRRFDICVRILWALAAATFAITLIHYNVACTVLYSGSNLAIPPYDVWLACAPAWPLFSAPAATGALLVLLLSVRGGFSPSQIDAPGSDWGLAAPPDQPLGVETPIDEAPKPSPAQLKTAQPVSSTADRSSSGRSP